jgi:hypothetical protein
VVIGAAAFAPRLLRAARPALRRGLKQGMQAYTALRAATAEFVEDVEDLVAEVQGELSEAMPRAATTPEAQRPQSQSAAGETQ